MYVVSHNLWPKIASLSVEGSPESSVFSAFSSVGLLLNFSGGEVGYGGQDCVPLEKLKKNSNFCFQKKNNNNICG